MLVLFNMYMFDFTVRPHLVIRWLTFVVRFLDLNAVSLLDPFFPPLIIAWRIDTWQLVQ